MRRMMSCLLIVGAITFLSSPAANAQMQIYGAWHCGNDACTWASVRNMTDFDTKNHWLIDRGDGSGLPSVNLVILSFVNSLRLFNKTNDRADFSRSADRDDARCGELFQSQKHSR